MTEARTDTQTVEIDAQPGDVPAVPAAAPRLPEWAHAFTDTVRPADGVTPWTASKDGQSFPLRVVVHEAAHTVDYLPGIDREIGGHARVLPRPGGGAGSSGSGAALGAGSRRPDVAGGFESGGR